MADLVTANVQDVNFFAKVLKENYLPVWRNLLGTEPSPLLAKIKIVTAPANEIISVAPKGLSGGFGYGKEGMDTPDAGPMLYERFTETLRDMYVNIMISDKVIKISSNSRGAMLNALDAEVKGAYSAAKWNLGRSLFGNGLGILANVSASSTNTISVDSTKRLMEGLIIDFYPAGAAVGSASPVAGRRILAIDRVGKKIVISGAPTSIPAGFITVQHSYGLEITGLGAIYDDNITHLYGLKKADYPVLKPLSISCENDLQDSYITDALRRAKDERGTDIDLIMCGNKAFDHYVDYLRTNNIRNEKTDLTIEGGFKAIAFVFGNRAVPIVCEQFIPDNECWGVHTGSLQLHRVKDWDFVEQGGPAFNLMPNTAVFRALLCFYANLICENPGGCIRLYDCV